MPLLEEKVYTIDDIYALPEGERAELIDGHIYYMAPPNRTHQTGLLRLFLPVADRWTIILSCLSTGLLVFANIGLLILQKILFWYMILKITNLNSILCRIPLRLEFMMIWPLTLDVWISDSHAEKIL